MLYSRITQVVPPQINLNEAGRVRTRCQCGKTLGPGMQLAQVKTLKPAQEGGASQDPQPFRRIFPRLVGHGHRVRRAQQAVAHPVDDLGQLRGLAERPAVLDHHPDPGVPGPIHSQRQPLHDPR